MLECGQAPLQLAQLILGERAHVPLEHRIGDHLAQARGFLLGCAPVLDPGGDRLELGVFDGQRGEVFAASFGHGAAELGMPGENAVELGFEIPVGR